MLTAFLMFCETYLLLLILGLGPSCWLSRPYKNQLAYTFALSPVLGYALLSVLCIYPLAESLSNNNWLTIVFEILLTSSISLTLGYIFLFRKKIAMPQWRFATTPIWITLTIGVIWLYLHNFQNGLFYHHLNPDIIGFTTGANWIAANGNVFATAPEPHELLVAALRWGFPACLAVIKLTLHTSVYQIIFPVVLIIFSHCIVLITLLITDKYQQDWYKTGQIIAIAILLQGSLLNFINEGFYPYIIGVGYFSVVSAFSQFHSRAAKLPYQSLIIIALSMATLIVTCSELFCLSAMFLLGVTMIHAIRKESIKVDVFFLLAMCLGVALVYPLSCKMVQFTLANSANARNIGYLQPTWLWPSEILGLMNIYSHAQNYLDTEGATHVIHRSALNFIPSFMLSLWVLYELTKWRKNTHYIVMIIGICGLLLINIFLIRHTNYLYSKLAVAFAPGLICLFFIKISQEKHFYLVKLSIASTCILFSACAFLQDQSYSKSYIDIESLNTIQKKFKNDHCFFITDSRGLRRSKMVKTLRYIDRTDDILMNAFLDGRQLDTWAITGVWGYALPKIDATTAHNQQITEVLSRKIILIGNRTHFPKALLQDHQPILETRSYYVFDTGSTLSELVQGDNRTRNMQRIYATLHETY